MKKIIVLLTAMCIIFSSSITAFGDEKNATQNNGTTVLVHSESEVDKLFKKEIDNLLIRNGIDPSNNTILLDGESITRNDLNDYKTVYSEEQRVVVTGIPGGQLKEGIKFSSPSGGIIYYTPEGGPSESISVGFSYGAVSVTFPLGKKVSRVTGHAAIVPGDAYYKIKAENEYACRKYTIYKKIYNEFDGYTWQEWSGGINKILVSVNVIPFIVKY